MEIAIMDDMPCDRIRLRDMVRDWLDENRLQGDIHIYENSESLLAAWEPGRFAVIFLDIILGDGKETGVEIARLIRQKDEEQVLVFTTAEGGYALDGFAVQALDYLVKPFSRQQIASVMKRVCRTKPEPVYIEIKENRDVSRIPANAILYIASVNRTLEVVTEQGIFRTTMSLTEAGEKLSRMPQFQNCCRGFLVNLDQVKDMDREGFLMYNGMYVPVSRSKRAAMREAYIHRLFFKTRSGEGER